MIDPRDFTAAADLLRQQVGSSADVTTVRDTPRGSMLRLGEACARIDHRPVDVTAMLAVASRVLAHGVRVPKPLSPIAHQLPSGAIASLWTYIPSRGEIDFGDVGIQMQGLRSLAPSLAQTSWREVYEGNCMGYPTMISSTLCSPGDIAQLTASLLLAYEGALDNLEQEEVSFAHGDLHPGNIRQGDSGAYLLDWEMSMQAPACWDLVPLFVRDRMYADYRGAFDAARAGSGLTDDLERSPLFQSLVLVRQLVEVAGMGVWASFDPAGVPEFQTRLSWALNGSVQPWTWPEE